MLDGVEFALYEGTDTECENPVMTATSVNGVVTFKDLKIGTYLVKESKTSRDILSITQSTQQR